jgi:hypothetical protein
MEYYSALKTWDPAICDNKNEPGGNMLYETSQAQNDKCHTASLICGNWSRKIRE